MPEKSFYQKNDLGLLPPVIDYDPLVRIIGEAHGALGELNGLLRKNILSPSLLAAPLLTKEAVLSSARSQRWRKFLNMKRSLKRGSRPAGGRR